MTHIKRVRAILLTHIPDYKFSLEKIYRELRKLETVM